MQILPSHSLNRHLTGTIHLGMTFLLLPRKPSKEQAVVHLIEGVSHFLMDSPVMPVSSKSMATNSHRGSRASRWPSATEKFVSSTSIYHRCKKGLKQTACALL